MLLELFILQAKMYSLISCTFFRGLLEILSWAFSPQFWCFSRKKPLPLLFIIYCDYVSLSQKGSDRRLFWCERVFGWWWQEVPAGPSGTEFPGAHSGNNLREPLNQACLGPLFRNYCLNLETPVHCLPSWPSTNPSCSSSSFSMAGPLKTMNFEFHFNAWHTS